MVKVKVSNPASEEIQEKVYLLLDEGSQRSSMTNRSAKVLNASITGIDRLEFHTFAATNSVKFLLPETEIDLHLSYKVYRTLRLNVITSMTT